MKSLEKQEYIDYRMRKAYETFNASKVLIENKFWNSAVNRLYYSCFYAINALLIKSDITAKTHATVKSQFSLNFIKKGIIKKKYGILYSDLFDWRQKGDYNDFFDLNEEAVLSMVKPVEELLGKIKTILKENHSF